VREKETSEEDRNTFAKQRVINSRNSRSILSPLLIEVSSQLLRDLSGKATNQDLGEA
jgi:DNA polymerase III sliding clamp (beta) subunit (PCNA family)